MLELNSRHVGKVTTPTSARNMDSVVVANLVLDTTCGQELHHAAGLLLGYATSTCQYSCTPIYEHDGGQ